MTAPDWTVLLLAFAGACSALGLSALVQARAARADLTFVAAMAAAAAVAVLVAAYVVG